METHLKSPTPAEIGKAIQAARKAQLLTQADLALAAGVSTPFLSALENGKPTVRLDVLLRVLNALNMALDLSLPHGLSAKLKPKLDSA